MLGRTARRPHPDHRFAAELVRPLEQAEVRAVVVRRRRSRLSAQRTCGGGLGEPGGPPGGAAHDGHPLTAPDVRPLTIQRCRKRNSATTGTIAISAPAANGPQVFSYAWLTKPYMPTGSV